MTSSNTAYPSSKPPVFSCWRLRVILALVLPFVLATLVSQALTFLFLRGADGFFVSLTLLFTLLWAAAFFHCFYDRSIIRVLSVQGAACALALVVIVPAILNQS